MAQLKAITAGELLLEEFLIPMGLTQYRVAKTFFHDDSQARTRRNSCQPPVVTHGRPLLQCLAVVREPPATTRGSPSGPAITKLCIKHGSAASTAR